MKRLSVISFTACLAGLVQAAPTPTNIPRSSNQTFRSEGLFKGGSPVHADLRNIRFGVHEQGEIERWVVDFTEVGSQAISQAAPRFQLRYLPSERVDITDGKELVRQPARFVFLFRSIHRNLLQAEQIKKLARRSQFVAEVVVYPPIEDGDMAMEFILKDDVVFEAHQPIERAGRLVVDLRHPDPEAVSEKSG